MVLEEVVGEGLVLLAAQPWVAVPLEVPMQRVPKPFAYLIDRIALTETEFPVCTTCVGRIRLEACTRNGSP